MPKSNNFNLLAIFALIFATFIWGSSFIALKLVMQDLGEFTVLFFRMLVASLCFIYFVKGFIKYKFTKKDIQFILLLGFFEPCLYFIFEAKALLYTSASQAGMITSLMPIITAMAAGYFLKEIITKQLIFGSLLATSAAIWLSLQATTTQLSPDPLLGNFLELCAMICGAGYTIVARYLSDKFSALFITAIQSFIGAIFFFPFFLYEYFTTDIHFTNNSIGWIFYLGVIVTLGGYGLYNFALTKIDASKASMFIYLLPVFTLILAYAFLDETLSSSEFLACGFILAGVVLSQIKFRRPKQQS